MKKFYFLFVFLFSTLSLTIQAQDPLYEYLRYANRYAQADLHAYRQRLRKEYRISSDRILNECFRQCGKNWGNVRLALEVAHRTGKDVKEVCRYYQTHCKDGWKRILYKIGIQPGTHYYKPFYDWVSQDQIYWANSYNQYYIKAWILKKKVAATLELPTYYVY